MGPLSDGDVVEVEIEGIGVLRNPVRAESDTVPDALDGVPLRAPGAHDTEEGMSVSSPAATLGVAHAHADEDVLCIARTTIFPGNVWHGLVTRGLERVLRTIRACSEYRPRHLVEDDPTQQQVIPYCIVHHPHDDTYLITRRLRHSSERRLHNLYSLGVGGHVNPGDGERFDPVVGGLMREWQEEIVSPAPATARLVALLNEDSTPVGAGPPWPGLPGGARGGPRRGAGDPQARGRDHDPGGDAPLLPQHGVVVPACYDDLVAGAPARAERSPLVVEPPPAP